MLVVLNFTDLQMLVMRLLETEKNRNFKHNEEMLQSTGSYFSTISNTPYPP